MVSKDFLGTAQVEKYSEGDVIYREGEQRSRGFRFVLDGQLKVSHGTDPDGALHRIGNLKKGEFFGEMSLLAEKSSHFATVTVESSSARLICFSTEAFLEEAQKNIRFSYGLFRQVLHRMESVEQKIRKIGWLDVDCPEPLAEVGARLREKNIELIEYMGKTRLGFASHGTKIYQRGQLNNRCIYSVIGGEAVVSVQDKKSERDVLPLIEGDLFGTSAVLNSKPRIYTVRVVSDHFRFAFVDRDLFRKTILLDPGLFLNIFRYACWNLMRLENIYRTIRDAHAGRSRGPSGQTNPGMVN